MPAANMATIRVDICDISGAIRFKAQTAATSTLIQATALITWKVVTAPAAKYPARISRFWVEFALVSRRVISK